MAGAAAGSVRPACRVRAQSRGRQRRNRGLYARRQSRAHAPRHPAAEARPDLERAWHERPARARPPACSRTQRAGRAAARLGADRPRRADDRARGPRLAEPQFGRGAAGGARADPGRRTDEEPLRRGLSQADRARARGRRGRRARGLEHGDQRGQSARGQGLLRRGVQADRRHHRRQRRPQSHGAAIEPGRAASRSSTRPETSTDNGTTTSISTSSTSPKQATNGSRARSSGNSCRSWPSATGLRCVLR